MQEEKLSILCVDDDNSALNALKDLLKNKYHVFTAVTASDAVDILKIHTIAVMISDQYISETTGIELFRLSKRVSSRTVPVLLTGFSNLDAVVHAIHEGETYYFLVKPYTNEKLLGVIQKAVEQFNTAKISLNTSILERLNMLERENKNLKIMYAEERLKTKMLKAALDNNCMR